MINVSFCLTTAKEGKFQSSNEDFFYSSDSGLTCAISDGANESFDSKNWATFVCQEFTNYSQKKTDELKDEDVREMLILSRKKYYEFYSTKELTWSQQMAFDRGSYATIVAVYDKEDFIEILAIGDSIAMWKENENNFMSYKITDHNEFKQSPLLLSTNDDIDDFFFKQKNIKWGIHKLNKKNILNNKLFLLTDAIGFYALQIKPKLFEENIKQLSKFDNNSYRLWVEKMRQNGNLRLDDTTIVELEIK